MIKRLYINVPGHRSTSLLRIVVLLSMALAIPLQARTFTPVGVTNNLEARVAGAMVIDQQGYLWVGSREGLYRYDGYQTLAYLPDIDDPDSISDIDIRHVYEAGNGDIWVGTNTGGLNKYDPSTGKFTKYRHDSSNPSSILDDSVYGISEGPEDGLWVSTQKGLGRLDRESGRFENFVHDQEDPGSISINWGYNLHLGQSGTLWISTIGGGLNRWNPQSRNFTRYDLAALTQGSPKRNEVYSLYEASDGSLWAGTREGMVILDPENDSVEYFDMGQQDGNLPMITCMTADDQGRIWMGTMIRGVLLVDMDSKEWTPANPNPLGATGYLPAQPQISLTTSGDHLFVGTWGSGVYRAPLNESQFRLLGRENSGDALRNATISAVMSTSEAGRPWLGSFGGGPQHVDVNKNVIEQTQEDVGQIGVSGVLDIERDGSGRLYAATTDGLYQFSEDGIELSLETHDTDNPSSIGEGYVYTLLPSGNSDMWVGLAGSGLHFRNGNTGKYTVYTHQPDVADSLSGDFITTLLNDRPGYIWVGTRSNGLNRCRLENWSCERFTGRGGSASSLSHFHVTALYRDRRGRLWVGTDGGGLNQVLQDETGQVTGFEIWDREKGLLNDGIMAIAEDVDESLWLSTRHGLIRVNPATGQVVNFVAESGLPISHYNTNASASDGEYIYFGSVDGLLSFRKGTLLEARQPATVRLTGIQRSARGERPVPILWNDGGIKLPYNEVITLEFATLDFSESAHEYAYRLSEEEPWTELGSQRQIIFHGLAPGHYRFEARGRDTYGLWGQSMPLLLEIVPPFWMTMWFRLLVVIIAVLLGVALHLVRAARMQRRASEIQRLGERREQALEEALGGEAELAVLTPRQKEILQLIAEGQSTRSIAEILGVSIKTVEAHRANLMERLEIYDVPGLVRLAIRSRLVSSHE
jgi:ligand-binding sensor domain-containing protein/DNA-binding CsgD family transcriptional regulator